MPRAFVGGLDTYVGNNVAKGLIVSLLVTIPLPN